MDNTAVKIISFFDSLEEFLIGILFFTIPFGWTLSIVPLILFSATLIINIFTKPEKPKREKVLYFLPLISIFIWNLITLFYTENLNQGITSLTTQLALIVAAIAFLFNKIPPATVGKGFFMFVLGCLTSVIILYGIAIQDSSSIVGDAFIFRPIINAPKPPMLDTDINGNYFLGSALSRFVHPAYNALMLALAMFISLHKLRIDTETTVPRHFWVFCFMLFGLTMIFFSFIGTLILSSVIIVLIIGILSVQKGHYGDYSRAIYSILLIFVLLIIANPQARQLADYKMSDSLSKRAKVTQVSLNLIGDHWLLGTGIGDEKDEMVKEYLKIGDFHLAEKKANSHNQFLTTWVQSGLVGLLLLMWSMVMVGLRAKRKQVMLLHIFNVLVIVSFLFESMLLRYWGVITFTLFYGMLYFYSEDQDLVDRLKL